jgi:hypothetical protein
MAVSTVISGSSQKDDAFISEVREFAASRAPTELRERIDTQRLAADAFFHLLDLTDACDAGDGTTREIDEGSQGHPAVLSSVSNVIDIVIEQEMDEPGDICAMIAHQCFRDHWLMAETPVDPICWLVAVAFGVALKLRERAPELAGRLTSLGDQYLSSPVFPTSSPGLEDELVHLVVEYGTSCNAELIDKLGEVYLRAVQEMPMIYRLELLLSVINGVRKYKLGPNAYFPFLFRDPDFKIVATAALHAAEVYEAAELDPLAGVRELAAHARAATNNHDESRAVAIFVGLLHLGDRRVIDQVGPCWRGLSPEARALLAQRIKGHSFAPLIDWLVTWLEECEGGEFGYVAGALASIPSNRDPAEVLEVHRQLPSWDSAPGRACVPLKRWSFRDYGIRIRPRLLQIAADEQPPRVMYDVLKLWGIEYQERLLGGIEMRPSGSVAPPRSLVPLLGTAALCGSGLVETPMRLEDADFESRQGKLLFSWAIFNPFGPTWSCLGLMDTEDPGLKCMFYRMLNPFAQESWLVGATRDDDCASIPVVGGMIHQLFERGGFTDSSGMSVVLIGGGPPDLLQVEWREEEFATAMRQALRSSPELRHINIARTIRTTREFAGRPWDRARAQVDDAFASTTPSDSSPPSVQEAEVTDAVMNEWLALVTSAEHWTNELINFPAAWHGSIDFASQGSQEMAQNAYTFWQLDDFLARFGYRTFREMAELLSKGEAGAASPDASRVSQTDDCSGNGSPRADATTTGTSYRRSFEAVTEWCEAQDFESMSITNKAHYAGLKIVSKTMAVAEAKFEEVGRPLSELERLMRRPWALGYFAGVAYAIARMLTGESRIEVVQYALFGEWSAAHRQLGTADLGAMTQAAAGSKEFEEGMQFCVDDFTRYLEGDGSAPTMVEWLLSTR